MCVSSFFRVCVCVFRNEVAGWTRPCSRASEQKPKTVWGTRRVVVHFAHKHSLVNVRMSCPYAHDSDGDAAAAAGDKPGVHYGRYLKVGVAAAAIRPARQWWSWHCISRGTPSCRARWTMTRRVALARPVFRHVCGHLVASDGRYKRPDRRAAPRPQVAAIRQHGPCAGPVAARQAPMSGDRAQPDPQPGAAVPWPLRSLPSTCAYRPCAAPHGRIAIAPPPCLVAAPHCPRSSLPISVLRPIQLDKLLNLQELESSKFDKPAHDELLFITVHQVQAAMLAKQKRGC